MNYKQANAASPAGVALQESTKSIGLSLYELCHVVVTDSQIFMFEHAGNIEGDDWEPLVPAGEAGKYVLGEPLTEEEFNALAGKDYIVFVDETGEWRAGKRANYFGPSKTPGVTYYRWTPPTLPEPEPVTEVPANVRQAVYQALLDSESYEEGAYRAMERICNLPELITALGERT